MNENDSNEGIQVERQILRESAVSFEQLAIRFRRLDDGFPVLRSQERRAMLVELEGLVRRTVDLVCLCNFGSRINEQRKGINMKWLTWNNVMKAVVGAVGVAGAIVAAPVGALPAAVVAIGLKVVTYGGVLVGLGAAKYLPGHGGNAPAGK